MTPFKRAPVRVKFSFEIEITMYISSSLVQIQKPLFIFMFLCQIYCMIPNFVMIDIKPKFDDKQGWGWLWCIIAVSRSVVLRLVTLCTSGLPPRSQHQSQCMSHYDTATTGPLLRTFRSPGIHQGALLSVSTLQRSLPGPYVISRDNSMWRLTCRGQTWSLPTPAPEACHAIPQLDTHSQLSHDIYSH